MIELTIIAFILSYVSNMVGMGYGTIIVPILLLLGLNPRDVVVGVLLSQLVGNSIAGITHHKLGTIVFHGRESDRKHLLALVFSAIIAVAIAVLLGVKLSESYMKTYIGLIIVFSGIIVSITGRKKHAPSTGSDDKLLLKVSILSFIASFNKALTGAGYGPILVPGQILLKINVRKAIALSLISEVIVNTVAVVFYLAADGVNLLPALALTIGTTLAAPLASITVSKLDILLLTRIIGIATAIMGLVIIGKTINII